MRKIFYIAAALTFTGCATSDVTPMDGNTFMVSKVSFGGGLVTAAGPTARFIPA